MKIYTYSERGIVDSLVYSLNDDELVKKCAVKTPVVVKINPLCHLFFCIFITEVWSLTDMFSFQR